MYSICQVETLSLGNCCAQSDKFINCIKFKVITHLYCTFSKMWYNLSNIWFASLERIFFYAKMLKPCIDCLVELTQSSRCEECEKSRERLRGSSTQRGYDRDWQKLSKKVISTSPICGVCGSGRSKENPLTTDHIIPLSKGGTNNPDNLQVLCRRCNSKKGNRRFWQALFSSKVAALGLLCALAPTMRF